MQRRNQTSPAANLTRHQPHYHLATATNLQKRPIRLLPLIKRNPQKLLVKKLRKRKSSQIASSVHHHHLLPHLHNIRKVTKLMKLLLRNGVEALQLLLLHQASQRKTFLARKKRKSRRIRSIRRNQR